MKEKTYKIFYLRFVLILSIAFFVFALSLYINMLKTQNSFIKTEAAISKIDVKEERDSEGAMRNVYYVYIDYSYNNTEYRNIYLDDWNSTMKSGDTIYVFVNPDNPTEIEGDNKAAANWILISSIAVLLVMLPVTVTAAKKSK